MVDEHKKIRLGKTRFFALVDASDYPVLSEMDWIAKAMGTGQGKKIYAATWNGVSYRWMHRLILESGTQQVDHIDGNPLNNQRSNLRICTTAQNAQNGRRLRSTNTSGFKGVSPALNGRWVAQICCNKQQMRIGFFEKAEEAAKAYDTKALEVFGEFACTNKMLGLI